MTVRIGSHYEGLRVLLWYAQDGRCFYCGMQMWRSRDAVRVGEKATIDHVLPSSKGGNIEKGNIVWACSPCNQSKGSRTPRGEDVARARQLAEAVLRPARR